MPDISASMERSQAERRFRALFDTHRALVLGYALRRVDEPADAADVVAETFLVAWRRLDDVPEGDAARGWLLGVARRVLANQRRGERRRDGLADRLAHELTALPVEDGSDGLVRVALARLTAQDRELLLLAWAVEVAKAVPRLLVGDWTVTRADEVSVGEGEMDFSDGARTVQLSWRKDDEPIQKPGVLGWKQDGYALELRGEAAVEARAALRTVSVDEWLRALPSGVVRPDQSSAVIDEMLADLPLPPGFDRARLDTAGAPRDRYQLGVRVAGAVACGWIETWLESEGKPRAEAVAALQTSRHWTVLKEMNREGDYPEVVWEYAAAVAGKGQVVGGKTLTVERSYADALAC